MWTGLRAVGDALHALLARAVGAAVDRSVRLDAVPDDPAVAVIAGRREGVDRALEGVERVRLAVADDLERLVVLVPAYLTLAHAPELPGGSAGETRTLDAWTRFAPCCAPPPSPR